MRRWRWFIGVLFYGACIAVSIAASVAAAPSLSILATRRDPNGAVVFAPTITDRKGELQPPLALPGEYLVVTGSGFPPNTPITASINDGTKTIPLTYRDLMSGGATPQQPPVTDAMGGIGGAAFAVPPAAQLTGRRDTIAVSAGGVVSAALVNVDLPDANATSGDTLVVGAAVAFYLIVGIFFIVLLRGLPTYPMQRAATQGTSANRPHAAA